jgi:hypothetical protein
VFEILFFTGTRAASNCATILGFNPVDQTGNTLYTGSMTSGTVLVPSLVGYNYLRPEFNQKQFGNVNISASGVKEAIVFQTQRFTQVQFKYEPEAKVLAEWAPFAQWYTKQRLFEFVPNIGDPNTFYEVTMEKTQGDGKGLAYHFSEMLPEFPNHYDIGMFVMRLNEV